MNFRKKTAIALVALMPFSVAACDDEDDDGAEEGAEELGDELEEGADEIDDG